MKAPVVFDLGFRIFFLCASLYGVVAVSLWSLLYFGWLKVPCLA